MIEPIDGLIDKDRFIEEMYEQESWTSSGSYRDLMICPSLRSYSSLDLLSCKNKTEEECRLVNLNNVIKKLFDTIDDPIKKEDVSFVCCLLGKLLKYNGSNGFIKNQPSGNLVTTVICKDLYAKHLPQIGEILEFLAMQAKKVEQYLYYLYELLELCCKPLLVQNMSDYLTIKPKLQRYFSLLGYLLVLAPTKASFDMVKKAIEVLVSKEEDKTREDIVMPDVRHEAVEQSRLPLTLAELTEVASTETYPAVLQLTLAVASVSRICCHRMLEAEIESRILIRMHPAYECGFECAQITDQTNLLLDKEDYIKTAECATKILCRLTTSIIIADELPKECKITSPTKQAMWSLRAAFRRELLRARGSSASRKLRNELANLILTGITRCTAQWELVETGLIDDLTNFFVATEFDIIDCWAKAAKVEVNNITGLEFKKTLLTILVRAVDMLSVCTLRNKQLVSGLLQLIDPTSCGKSVKMLWNSEQLWHLFKYASNALTYLVPKIPDEFIEDNGSLRLLSVLERFTTDENYENTLIACFTEMICSLSLANCDMITRHFREHGFIPVLFKMIRRILNFEALAIKHQRVITYLLVAAENILSIDDSSDECFCETNIKITIDLLHRCLHQKDEDSELEQSFLIAIGSFIWKCIIHCPSALSNFLQSGGLYQCLDITERANLPVQNLYLGLLADISENEFCRRYLFSWKQRVTDKRNGILSLLANVWRYEERIFGVERTRQGCILNTETPLLNDEQWLYINYLKSACDLDVLTTTAVGSIRPKIYHLLKLIVRLADNYRKDYFKKLFDELSTEDQITILAVESYKDLKSDEASVGVLSQLKISPLTKSRSPLLESTSKLNLWSARSRKVREHQEKLLEKLHAEEAKEELETLERIRHAKLNPAFDTLTELSFVTAASVRSYRLAKLQEMKTMKNQRSQILVRGPLFETCNFGANVTNLFNKEIKIQSIPNPSPDTTIEEVSTISSSKSQLLSSCHSQCSTTTDDSLFLQNYEHDDNGNVVFGSNEICI